MTAKLRRLSAALLTASLLSGLACSDDDLARLDEANVEAAARAATRAATEAFYAARVAETISQHSPESTLAGDPPGFSFNSMMLIVSIDSPYSDETCFETGRSEDGDKWYALNDCRFDGCWADGVIWRDDGADRSNGRRGFINERLVVDCGGDREIDLSGVEIDCHAYRDLDCTVVPSDARSSWTRVDNIGIREFSSPGQTPLLRYRYALSGDTDVPGMGRVAFETDLVPPSFDACSMMVPGSGELILRGSGGSRAEVHFRGCGSFSACLGERRPDAQNCNTEAW